MTFGNNGEAKYDHLPLEVGSDKLLTYAFPSYISPDYKDDMVIKSSQLHDEPFLSIIQNGNMQFNCTLKLLNYCLLFDFHQPTWSLDHI